MQQRKPFYILIGSILVASLAIYFVYSPRQKNIVLTGVVTGNDVVVSSKILGRIERLTVDEGDEVKHGDLIAQLDQPELKAQLTSAEATIRSLEAKLASATTDLRWSDEQTGASLMQAQAALAAAHAQLDEARADFEQAGLDFQRAQGLFEAQVVSAQDRDRAEAAMKASRARVQSLTDQVKAQQAALAVAAANRQQVAMRQSDLAATRAQLAQARAQKAEAETRLGYTQILSPLAGVVSVRVARQGEVVQPGAPIVTIIDLNHLWVKADVEESYISRLALGDKLEVRLPSGELLSGKLFFKGVESDFATQRDVSRVKRDVKAFSIKVRVDNPGRRLSTGMTAEVILPFTR
ncbi:MAG TPA: efflux RND transporter periplasmic adaptor subunit [Candidatus Acidoferrales bacterium]